MTALIAPTRYEATRDAIYLNLKAVEGIGMVHKSERMVEDWQAFFRRYVNDENILKIAWFSLARSAEKDSGYGSVDASDTINHMERSEFWRIQQFYGFHDDDDEPSAFEFENLCQRIEDQFRFLQNLNGAAFRTRAISRPFSGLWSLGGVLCHRAEFTLEVVHRIINPN